MKAFVGFVAGGVVGFILGVIIFRLAADPTDGWSDLTSLAGSLFTYAPVGALTGSALGLRRRSWPWGRMVIVGLILAAIPVLVYDGSTVTRWGLAAYAFFIGGLVAWRVGHRDREIKSVG